MIRALFCWEFIGPHHRARILASADRAPSLKTRGFALSDRSSVYDFYKQDDPQLATAYRSIAVETLTFRQRLVAYIRHVWFAKDDVYFLCHYERPEVFLTAVILRLRWKRVFVMSDSKFDDYQRYLWRELGKSFLYAPYCGALVSGSRSASYLRFLGIHGKIETGYDTIDCQAVLRNSRIVSDPAVPKPYFVLVARLIKRKNIELTVCAFRSACEQMDAPIALSIAGTGPDEEALKRLTSQLGVGDRVKFLGKLSNEEISPLIANSVALILMSTSEQWGLVVNEAVACNVPVIVSDAVGARDTLVRNFVNGLVIESDNEIGLAQAMVEMAKNTTRFQVSQRELHAANVERFADAVLSLVDGTGSAEPGSSEEFGSNGQR